MFAIKYSMTHGEEKKLNIHPTSKKKKELSSNNLTNLKMLLVKLNLVSFH